MVFTLILSFNYQREAKYYGFKAEIQIHRIQNGTNLEDILFSGKIKNLSKKVMFCNNKSIIFDLKSEQQG